MLDEANSEFVNHLVTVLRYGSYVVGVLIILGVGLWIWVKTIDSRDYDGKARQRMRDLGYK